MGCSNGYVLKRSKRKSLAISIVEAEVIVRAPMRLPMRDINQFVEQKRAWIAAKLNHQISRMEQVPKRRYQAGESFSVLGDEVRLELQSAARFKQSLSGERLILSGPRQDPETVKAKLELWYKRRAGAVFSEKVRDLSERSGIDYQSVRVRKTKNRWGYCTHDGILQFNWVLILAPEWVVDYVVAHELAHRVHFNHSPKFWALVNQLNSDVTAAKQWLNSHGHTLVV